MTNSLRRLLSRRASGTPPGTGGLSGRLVALAWLLTMAGGCHPHDPDKYVFSSVGSVQVDQLFSLSASGDSTLPADGFSSVMLVARVHNVTEGPRSILFTTTAGTLRVGSARRPDSAVVVTDLRGQAVVDLISSQEVVTARVVARVMGVEPALTQERQIRFVPVSAEDVFAFVEAPDSALAIGTALSSFTVRISPNLQGDDRKVTFETTQGAFVSSNRETTSGGDGQTRVVTAGADHRATVQLRSPDQASEALVTATVKGFTQERTIRFVPVPADSVLRFAEAPTSAPADGETLSRFVVRVSPALLADDNRQVVFETTQGTFAFAAANSTRITVLADASHQATAYLRSPNQIVEALLTASVKGFVQRRTVQFAWAGPDTLIVLTDRFLMKSTDQARLDVTLERRGGRGVVTRGMELSFQAADSLGNGIAGARFFNVTRSDAGGKASAVFTPDGSAYRGLVVITVRPTQVNREVAGRAILRVAD